MIPKVLVLRPEPGCSETLAAARKRGLEAISAPIFAIESVPWDAPDPVQFDRLIAGSANAFRFGGTQLDELTDLPVVAVGERTATAAREAGFTVAATGQVGLQALLDTIKSPARLLRLSGEERIDLAPPNGVSMVERTVYRAAPLPLADKAIEVLASGAVALLHSGEAARRFAAECDRLSIARYRISLAALAPRIATAAGSDWARIQVAPDVTDAALLAMAADMCH